MMRRILDALRELFTRRRCNAALIEIPVEVIMRRPVTGRIGTVVAACELGHRHAGEHAGKDIAGEVRTWR